MLGWFLATVPRIKFPVSFISVVERIICVWCLFENSWGLVGKLRLIRACDKWNLGSDGGCCCQVLGSNNKTFCKNRNGF